MRRKRAAAPRPRGGDKKPEGRGPPNSRRRATAPSPRRQRSQARHQENSRPPAGVTRQGCLRRGGPNPRSQLPRYPVAEEKTASEGGRVLPSPLPKRPETVRARAPKV